MVSVKQHKHSQNVLDVSDGTAFAKRPDRQSVAALTVSISELNVLRSTPNGETVVAIHDVVLLEQQISAARREACMKLSIER